MNKRKTLRLLLIFILIGFVISPAFADETTINLDQTTPYIDIPITVVEPIDATISTTTGLPNSGTWIDSWIELWQGTTRLVYNDDSNHNSNNWLASIINISLTAGEYFIRATSWNFIASNGTNLPVGSYLLSTNLIATAPSPTPTIESTVEPTPTPEPTIEPTVQPTPTPEVSLEPSQTPIEDNSNNEPTLPAVLPSLEPILEPTETAFPIPEIVEQIVESETIETPIIEPELSVEQQQQIIDEVYIAENTIELQLPSALDDVPGAAQILAATEAILNVGSDMTETQREESQTVVVSAIVLTQIASMAMVSAQPAQHKNETKRIKRK